MVVVRRDLLGKANPFTPGVFNYETNILADNVWNTIPTFNVDVVGIMMEWIMEEGGMASMERRSIVKADLMYNTIDGSDGFFSTPVKKESGYRSRMNAPFCVAGGDETLTNLFLVECWERGIIGLRTVTPFGTGIYLRASLYHGVSYEEALVLTDFMKEFAAKHSISKEVVVEQSIAMVTPPKSPPIHQALDKLDLCCTMVQKEFHQIHKLSTSPDTVMDTAMDSSLTWPKNLKVNQYSRLAHDMFTPPPNDLGSTPVSLR